MILDKESPKESILKTLKTTIIEFTKVLECKINIQKSIILLYTSNKQSEIKFEN